MKKKPHYAILREEKRSDMRQITRSSQHNNRARPPANARPDGPAPTLLFGDWKLPQAIKAIIPKDRRSNAVIAVEAVLTASPEWWGKSGDTTKARWIEANLAWLKERHGPNLVQVVLHEDESSPHLHAYWVPMKDGKLNYRAIQGTPQAMVEKQDSYAQAMAPFGLVRGQEKSRRKHEHHSKVVDKLKEVREAVKKAGRILMEAGEAHGNSELAEKLTEAIEILVAPLRPDPVPPGAVGNGTPEGAAPAVEHRPMWKPPTTRMQPGSLRP